MQKHWKFYDFKLKFNIVRKLWNISNIVLWNLISPLLNNSIILRCWSLFRCFLYDEYLSFPPSNQSPSSPWSLFLHHNTPPQNWASVANLFGGGRVYEGLAANGATTPASKANWYTPRKIRPIQWFPLAKVCGEYPPCFALYRLCLTPSFASLLL